MTPKQIRTKFGWTQKQFAEKLGVSFRTVQNWDQGRYSPDRRSQKAIGELTGFKFVNLRQKGEMLWGDCPYCNSKDTFSVLNGYMCHCYGCQKAGHLSYMDLVEIIK